MAAAVTVPGIGGCAAGPPAPRQLVPSGPAEVLADWDDLDGSVDLAAERTEMALVSISDPDGTGLTRRYELRTIAAETVELIASRDSAPLKAGPQVITLRATVGRFGSPERESLLLSYLKERLEALRGVDYRPL